MKIKQQQKELLDKFLIQYDNFPANGEFFDEHYIDSLLRMFLFKEITIKQ